TTDLRIWAAEIANIPLWLIEESYYVVGDLAETLSHIIGKNDSTNTNEINLHELIVQLKGLLNSSIEEKKELITGFWKQRTKSENFVFNKLITGNFRMGLSKQLV